MHRAAARQRHLRDFITRCATLNFEQIDARAWYVQSLCELLHVRAAGLLFVQDHNNELVLYEAGDDNIQLFYPDEFNWDMGLVEKSILTSTSVLLSHRQDISSASLFRPLSDLKPGRLLCEPLIFEGQCLGATILLDQVEEEFASWGVNVVRQVGEMIARTLIFKRQVKQLSITNAELEFNRWQLINSRNTLRALFDSVPFSIYIVDRDYTLCAVNMDMARRIKRPPNKLVGLTCYQAFYNRNDICPDCNVAQAFFNGRPANRVRRKWENDRDLMEWEINVYPIADENNQVVRAIVFEQDVTEKRRLEANLVQSEKLAAVGQLAAGIAHEIYNPLTAILANAQMMERELDPEDDRQELVELITKAGTRAAEVVRSLLDMARKEKYVFEPTDINETVQAALKLTNHEMVKRNISLTFDPDPALPFVNASKDHLQVVWVNLLANAMDAMGEGNHEIKIETSLHSNKVQIIFTDTGKGIPSENLPRIFEPFYTNKAAGQGTGLGLSVCHRIIKQHGGAIHVGSQLGKGTQFTIHLPLS